MGTTAVVPRGSPFFQGDAPRPLSVPWIGFFNDLLNASAAKSAVAADAAYVLEIPGTLGIGSDQAPKAYVLADVTPGLLRVDLKQGPVGANLVVTVSYYTTPGVPTLVATFTVAPGKLAATATTAVAVPAGAWWEVDITGVGTTFPGADLTVTVR